MTIIMIIRFMMLIFIMSLMMMMMIMIILIVIICAGFVEQVKIVDTLFVTNPLESIFCHGHKSFASDPEWVTVR